MAEVVTMPKLGFDMAEGVLVRWAVAEGDSVEKGELLAEIETDKATVEVESPHSGTVLKHIVPEDSVVPINDPIAVIGEAGESVDMPSLLGDSGTEEDAPAAKEAPESAAPTPAAMEAASEGGQLPEGVRASPVARNMARVEGINLADVNGSGPKGRIIKKDIEAYLKAPKKASAPTTALSAAPAYAAAARDDATVPLSKLRRAIGRRMTESKQWYPHFYVTYEYDLDNLMAARKQINTGLESESVKLSVNDFIVKASAITLRQYPNLNASLGDGEVVQHGHINIGIAVAVEGGLLTVVVQDADAKTLRQISAEVKEKAGRVRDGKVQPDDVSGSTFTTSNLGMFGVDDFTAIINPPEAAILALGGAKKVPVVKNGELAIGWRMKATISVDHRVSDGAEAAEFMRAMAKYLEDPLLMMA